MPKQSQKKGKKRKKKEFIISKSVLCQEDYYNYHMSVSL